MRRELPFKKLELPEEFKKLELPKERKTVRYISYPEKGKIELQAGTTIINWREGYAFKPDKTRDHINPVPDDMVLQSLFCDLGRTVSIEVFVGGNAGERTFSSSLFTGTSSLSNLIFDYTVINATQATRAYILASTAPTAPSMQSDLFDNLTGAQHLGVKDFTLSAADPPLFIPSGGVLAVDTLTIKAGTVIRNDGLLSVKRVIYNEGKLQNNGVVEVGW